MVRGEVGQNNYVISGQPAHIKFDTAQGLSVQKILEQHLCHVKHTRHTSDLCRSTLDDQAHRGVAPESEN